jgi:putative aminopeptidase FrvX
MELLKQLCSLHGPSGNEVAVKEFLLSYLAQHASQWKTQPTVLHGEGFQDSMLWVFGEPRTAVFAHMDSVGFTVRYENQLVAIGGPDVASGYRLTGHDHLGPIECELRVDDDHHLFYEFGRPIARGTDLVYTCDFRESKQYIESCYIDNRLGIYNALQLAETLEHGILAFGCWEEHGGGAVPYLARVMYEQYGVKQALISDVTWVTDGIHHGQGVAISMRDKNIPRRSFVQKIISVAETSGIPFQLEVEGAGSSDGRELQVSAYPIDWCFVGAPHANPHTPHEKIHKADIASMVALYRELMNKL